MKSFFIHKNVEFTVSKNINHNNNMICTWLKFYIILLKKIQTIQTWCDWIRWIWLCILYPGGFSKNYITFYPIPLLHILMMYRYFETKHEHKYLKQHAFFLQISALNELQETTDSAVIKHKLAKFVNQHIHKS